MTRVARTYGYPPGGLRRDVAARYIAVGASKFDQLVDDGRAPMPARIDGYVVWDRRALGDAFDELLNPTVFSNPWAAHRRAHQR